MKRPQIEEILEEVDRRSLFWRRRHPESLLMSDRGTMRDIERIANLCEYVLYLEAEGRKIVGLLIPAQTLTGSDAITTTSDQEET